MDRPLRTDHHFQRRKEIANYLGAGPQTRNAARTTAGVSRILLVSLCAVAAAAFLWLLLQNHEPAGFTVDSNVLTAVDEHHHELWTRVFPTPLTTRKTESQDWPHKFITGPDGHRWLLFAGGRVLYCFDSFGKETWTRRLGQRVVTRRGETISDDYRIRLVESLDRPHRNGGQVIVGGAPGSEAVFLVELLNMEGQRVDSYYHSGEFFGVRTGSLAGDGHQDIFLAGMDNESGLSSGYAATLVALDPDHPLGDATTAVADRRTAIRDVPQAAEKAVILIRDLAPATDSPMACRGSDVKVERGSLSVWVSHGGSSPGAWFRFDQKLQLQQVEPSPRLSEALQRTLLSGVPAEQWPEKIKASLGDIRYVRNELTGIK